MATKLLPDYLFKLSHIALFMLLSLWGYQLKAQSVLLPGDVAVVSVNADNNSVDLLPLIDIEKGTVINLSAGKWDPSEGLLTGTEATLYFTSSVQAGSNIHVGGQDSDFFEFNGRLPFVSSQNQFYIYQKEEGVYRFIYGLRFGDKNVDLETLATEIPPVLSETEKTFVQLGERRNHQYYIKNGASGTQNMLLGFLGDPGNWNSSETPFAPFGTSFNILSPPVVMFENTSSTFEEGDSLASLKVTVYEHDGSRVSVDVSFETYQSSADSLDFSELNNKTLNFTGLVGTYIIDIPLAISEDDKFEGREGAIFYLENLTDGSLGDFISHSVAIEDNKVPNLVITEVSNDADQGSFIEISNLEDSDVSLKGWVLSTDNSELSIDSSVVLGAYKKIRVYEGTQDKSSNMSVQSFNLKGLNKQLLSGNGGLLSLQNYKEKVVHQVGYRRFKPEQNNAIAADITQNRVENERSVTESNKSEASAVQPLNDGWTVISMNSELAKAMSGQKNLYGWDDGSKSFGIVNEIEISKSEIPVLGFFEAEELDSLEESGSFNEFRNKTNENNLKTIKLNAIDLNENGRIDGNEGLNLLQNSTGDNIVVGALLNTIHDNLELNSSIEVIGINRDPDGTINFESLNETDIVASGSYFWVKLESQLESAVVKFESGALSAENNEFSDERRENLDAETGFIELGLRSGSTLRNIDLYIESESKRTNKLDLNANSEILPEEYSPFIFAVKQNENFFNEVSIPGQTEQMLNLPLSFGSPVNDAYTLTVDSWENIPSDWSITLLDTYSDKEYDLGADFAISFDEAFNSNEKNQNSERFVIQITPAVAQQEAFEAFSDVPKEIELNQNYPNPFNPVTTISFYLPESQDVKLSIFNIVGQPVAVLFEGRLSSGQQQFEWDATDKPSGMYIYQLEVGDKVMTRKMTLVK